MVLVLGILPPPQASALTIQFDYRYDTTGFFSGANHLHRMVLEMAGQTLAARFGNLFPAIQPSASNHWTLSFPRPDTGQNVTLKDTVLPADTIVVYVGARPLDGNLLGTSYFAYTYNGDSSWNKAFSARDDTNSFTSIGGSIVFDPDGPWYFDPDPSTVEEFGDTYDFYSLAMHELGHILGFTRGTRAFAARTAGETFVGTNAVALYGRPVPLASDVNHYPNELEWKGQQVGMAHLIYYDERRPFTDLDWAAFDDIGYQIVAPRHALRVALVDGRIQVSWPVVAIGFGLESASLDASPRQWQPVTQKPQILDDRKIVTLDNSGTGLIFRLREQ